ncbi:MAG: YdbL family protein [Verrucomicrobiota bacterium]|nr:YdbL family protein [Verrucomicrobiota bacterium]
MPTISYAQDAAVQTRIKDRLPQMDALLSAGLVGENNEGFVTSRGALNPEQQKTLSAENADRAAVYTAIAQKTGQPAPVIGKQRAEQIRQRAVKGVWLQGPDGKWYQK